MIRKYNHNDLGKVLEIFRLNTPEYFHPSEETDLRQYLEQEIEDYFVVEAYNQIIASGGINYFPKQKIARISWDVITPHAQGKGVGSELMAHRLNFLLDNPDVEVIVVRTTQKVYLFYEKMGFKLEKMEKDFWAEGFDLYEMSKKNISQ